MVTDKQIAGQIEAVNKLIDRASLLTDDGDRSPYNIRAFYTFEQAKLEAGELVFNVPADADFRGTRINLYLGARTIDITSEVASDLVYRPADWLHPNDWKAISINQANAAFSVRDSMNGEYQNAPVNINSAFSARYGVRNTSSPFVVGLAIPVTAYLGGLDFDVPYFVKRGNAVTVKITPLYAGPNPTEARRLDLRIVGVFHGYKKVRAFR